MIVLSITFLSLTALFFLGWGIAMSIKNVSIVDAMWALSLPLPVTFYILYHPGNITRDLLLITMALLWSLRLGIHLTKRIYRHHPNEDPRYAALRKHWGKYADKKFIIVFFINALLIFLFSHPFYFASQNTTSIQLLEYIGLAIFIIGVIGETIADNQLASFIKTSTGKEICQKGLWNYSRHPNYFFEAVIWIGIYLFCAASPTGAYTIYAPALMIFLLVRVTGIPFAEISSLKSKGDAYKHYQQTTSPFIPWFKKSKQQPFNN